MPVRMLRRRLRDAVACRSRLSTDHATKLEARAAGEEDPRRRDAQPGPHDLAYRRRCEAPLSRHRLQKRQVRRAGEGLPSSTTRPLGARIALLHYLMAPSAICQRRRASRSGYGHERAGGGDPRRQRDAAAQRPDRLGDPQHGAARRAWRPDRSRSAALRRS